MTSMERFRITFTANDKRQFLQRPPPMLPAGSISYPCDDALDVGVVLRGFPTGTPAFHDFQNPVFLDSI